MTPRRAGGRGPPGETGGSEPAAPAMPLAAGPVLGTVDAVDEGVARIGLDGGGSCIIPARLLPPGAGEGSRISISLATDPTATARAREELAALRKRLSAADDGGDIEL